MFWKFSRLYITGVIKNEKNKIAIKKCDPLTYDNDRPQIRVVYQAKKIPTCAQQAWTKSHAPSREPFSTVKMSCHRINFAIPPFPWPCRNSKDNSKKPIFFFLFLSSLLPSLTRGFRNVSLLCALHASLWNYRQRVRPTRTRTTAFGTRRI